jgi:hypothetical protein
MDSSADFQILLEFLGRCGPEVSGNHLGTPRTLEAEKLIRFAYGDCAEDERIEVCHLLRLNPAWIRWLADRVKLARTSGPVEHLSVPG